MNPLYEQLMGRGAAVSPSSFSPPANPMQRMGMLMQAMQNPAAFVKQAFPDIPDEISGNPGQILTYLQQSRGISPQSMNQMAQTAQSMFNQMPHR